MKTIQKTKSKPIVHILTWVPMINFFILNFFGETPSLEGIKRACEVAVLSSALLFGLIGSIPFTVTEEELVRVDLDWSRTEIRPGVYEIGKYGCVDASWDSAKTDYASVRMIFYVHISMHCLGATLLIASVIIWSANSLDAGWTGPRSFKAGRGPTIEPVDENENQNFLLGFIDAARARQWWFWMRWIALLMFIFLVVGVLTAFQSLQEVTLIKFPNHYLKDLCQKKGWVFDRYDTMTGARIFVNGTFTDWPTDAARFNNRMGDPSIMGKIYSWVLMGLIGFVLAFTGLVGQVASNRHRYYLEDSVDDNNNLHIVKRTRSQQKISPDNIQILGIHQQDNYMQGNRELNLSDIPLATESHL
eukprot:m.69550 g.69550  ORF g.69550 m.69550 type:complete len:360 (+) comp12065_c0_seq2:459-1538(+)